MRQQKHTQSNPNHDLKINNFNIYYNISITNKHIPIIYHYIQFMSKKTKKEILIILNEVKNNFTCNNIYK
jgi:hypothetical protein